MKLEVVVNENCLRGSSVTFSVVSVKSNEEKKGILINAAVNALKPWNRVHRRTCTSVNNGELCSGRKRRKVLMNKMINVLSLGGV